MIPNGINYYRYKGIDDTPSLSAYETAVNSVVQQYDKALDRKDTIVKTLGAIQSNKFGNEYLSKIADNINKTLDGVATTVAGTKRWDLADNTLRELSNQIASDKVIQSLKLSHENYLKGKETERELSKTGEVVNLSDEYDDYKPLNPDGSVNIYNPIYQKKADNYGAIKKIAKDLPTEIKMEVNKSQSIPGYLEVNQVKRAVEGAKDKLAGTYLKQYLDSDEANQQAILLRKDLKKQGLNDAQIAKKVLEAQTQTVKQSLDLYEQEVFENKPQLVADQVYARKVASEDRKEMWAMQQQARIDDREDRQDATEEQIRLRAALAQQKAEATAKAKASGKVTPDNAPLLTRTTGLGRTTESRDNVTGTTNPEYLDALKDTIDIKKGRGATAWDGIAFDKDQIPDLVKNPELINNMEIVSFIPKGITAYNESDPSFDGAWYGDLTYHDKEGKPHIISANVRNTDTSLRTLYGDVSTMQHDRVNLEKMPLGPKGYVAGVVKSANPNFFERSKKPVYLQMVRTKEGIKVVPMIKGLDDYNKEIWLRPARLPSATRNELGLSGIKEHYSVEEMRTMADNDFLDTARARVLSKKQLSEIPPAQ